VSAFDLIMLGSKMSPLTRSSLSESCWRGEQIPSQEETRTAVQKHKQSAPSANKIATNAGCIDVSSQVFCNVPHDRNILKIPSTIT